MGSWTPQWECIFMDWGLVTFSSWINYQLFLLTTERVTKIAKFFVIKTLGKTFTFFITTIIYWLKNLIGSWGCDWSTDSAFIWKFQVVQERQSLELTVFTNPLLGPVTNPNWVIVQVARWSQAKSLVFLFCAITNPLDPHLFTYLSNGSMGWWNPSLLASRSLLTFLIDIWTFKQSSSWK